MDEFSLRQKCGNAPLKVIQCPRCPERTLPISAEPHPEHAWCVILECGICGFTWFCCRECSTKNTHITKQTLRRHLKDKHANDPIPMQTTSTPTVGTASRPNRQMASGTYPDFDFKFSRIQSYHYFRQQHFTQNGLDFIIYKALCDGKKIGTKRINDTYLETIIRMIKTCDYLPREGHRIFAECIKWVTLVVENEVAPSGSPKCEKLARDKMQLLVPIPRTYADLRSSFFDGSNSFQNNIPHPEILTEKDHAFLSLKDIVRDFFAKGGSASKLSSLPQQIVTHSSHSPRAAQICNMAATGQQGELDVLSELTIGIIDWGDGATVTNSIKGNESVYCRTVTFVTHEKHPGVPHMNTYPLSISMAGINHDIIERRFASEIQELCATPIKCYSPKERRPISVRLGLMCTLADQPEKRKETGLLSGGSLQHGRWGYSYRWNDKKDVMVPCDDCFQHMLQADGLVLYEYRECTVCANWAHDECHPLLGTLLCPTFPSRR